VLWLLLVRLLELELLELLPLDWLLALELLFELVRLLELLVKLLDDELLDGLELDALLAELDDRLELDSLVELELLYDVDDPLVLLQDELDVELLLELLLELDELELLLDSELRLELELLWVDRLLVRLELELDSSSISKMRRRSPVCGPGN